MEPKYDRLLIWVLAFFLLFVELLDIADDGWAKYWEQMSKFTSQMLTMSSVVANAIYAAGGYTILLFLRDRLGGWSYLLLPAVFPLGAAVRYLVEEVLFLRWFGFDNYYDTVDAVDYLLDNLYYAIPFSAVGIVFYFVQYSRYRERQSQELRIQNQKTELAFLRFQINPHFLFNTINNVYTLVYQKSGRALTAMETLTGMLRYALYENAERVPLAKEWQYIEDFIDLQRLRYGYDLQLELQTAGSFEGIMIPPLAFIPIVENAFKHGELRDPKQPLRIRLERTPEFLLFQTRNSVRAQHKDEAGGIGLPNIHKRLSLIYQDRHEWSVKRTENQFEVSLKIPISLCSNA